MNKHNEANRSRRVAAKLRNILTTLKGLDAQILAIQANDEIDEPRREFLVKKVQEQAKLEQAHRLRLENRVSQLAYEDKAPVISGQPGNQFTPRTIEIFYGKSVPISRRQCKATRAFYAVCASRGQVG